jgi:peptide/nickel transport system substrate-binding protein
MRWIRTLVLLEMAALLLSTAPSWAEKPGGILRIYHRDSPASMSVLEEASLSTSMPMMPVFNNLVIYDQHVPQNSIGAIVPDLIYDGWRMEDVWLDR